MPKVAHHVKKTAHKLKKQPARLLKPKQSFSNRQLLVFALIFALIGGYAIYRSLAATTQTKTWDSQADFSSGTLAGTTATADGHVTLNPTTTGGGGSYSFQRNLIESGTQTMNAVASGDISGDGKDDIVLAGDSYIAWYDQPSFTKHIIATSSGSNRIFGAGAEAVVRDINNDGRRDVVVGDLLTLTENWYENTISGWVPHLMYGGAKFHDIAFGDFDGNGKTEAIGVDQYVNNQILLLTPGADTTQPWSTNVVASGNYMGIVTGDINQDGKLDFVTGRSWFRNNGGIPATFTRFSFTNLTPSGANQSNYFTDYSKVNLVDLNGDGKLDLFAVIFAESLEGHAYAFLQPADPTQPWTSTLVDNGPLYAVHSQLEADFDGSGAKQILVGESNQGGFSFPAKSGGTPNIYMYKLTGNPASGAGWQKTTIDNIGTHETALGDFNSDGRPDFTGHLENTSAAGAQFHWWTNNTSSTSTTYPSTGSVILTKDALVASNWSNLRASPTTQPSGTNVIYDARTSTDNVSWSAWNTNPANLPAGRYIQVRASLSTTNSSLTPSIDNISIDYLAAADTTPPSTPTSLSATAPDSTHVNLSWQASTDNTAVTAYNIYRNGSTTPLATLTAASTTDLPLITDFTPVTDNGCGGCSAAWNGSNNTLTATVAGGADTLDTAYGLKDFGGTAGWSGMTYARTELGLPAVQALSNNLAVFQEYDTAGNLIYELYLGADKALNLWSPAGGLRTSSINQPVGVVVPNGSTIRVEVAALANNSIVVRVNDADKITLTGLSGATTTNPRYLRAGIDHYDAATMAETVTALHSNVGITTIGWLGTRPTLLSPAIPAYSDSTVLAGTSYTYQVSAVDAAGNQSPKSSVVNVSTPASAPPPPPTPVPGDINGDSKVDFLDLSILVKNYGLAATRSTGDLNGDSKVDFLDLSVLVNNWAK